MLERSGDLVIALSLSATLLACGASNDTTFSAGGASGSPGSGGSSAGGDGGSNTAGTTSGGTSSGGNGSGGASSGGVGPTGCSGAFGEPQPLFVDQDLNPQSMSLTEDELELFYMQREPTSNTRRLVVRSRTARTAAFEAPVEPPELIGLCGQLILGSLDISGNGLRLYVGCENDALSGEPVVTTVRIAERPNRTTPFTISPTPLATTGISIGLSTDELTLFAASGDLAVMQPIQHRRLALGMPFGAGEPVPGLTSQFRNPEPTSDGLQLFGAISVVPSGTAIAVATRPSVGSAFTEPSTAGMPIPPEGVVDASPAISADCRTLYFLRVDTPGGGTTQLWVVYTARR